MTGIDWTAALRQYDIELLDGIACALLAAAATARARLLGASFSGAILLGCLCGLLFPCLREALLHGQPGVAMVLAAMPDDALAGSIGSICAIFIIRSRTGKLFFWLDAASLGLASTLGAILAIREFGMAGALVAGVATAAAPGVLRDTALGDTAMLVEKSWYGMAAVTGCLFAYGVLLAPLFLPLSALAEKHALMLALLSGTSLTIGLRRWRGYNEI